MQHEAHPQALGSQGVRYSYPKDFRAYMKAARVIDFDVWKVVDIDLERTLESWLLEYVGCGLRTTRGIDLECIKHHGYVFEPDSLTQEAAAQSKILMNDKFLILSSAVSSQKSRQIPKKFGLQIHQ